jgi:hypothetical protein
MKAKKYKGRKHTYWVLWCIYIYNCFHLLFHGIVCFHFFRYMFCRKEVNSFTFRCVILYVDNVSILQNTISIVYVLSFRLWFVFITELKLLSVGLDIHCFPFILWKILLKCSGTENGISHAICPYVLDLLWL